MVKNLLTSNPVSEGAILLEKLDSLGVSPVAALWCFMPDSGHWMLLLADTRVGTKVPRAVYCVILKVAHLLSGQISICRAWTSPQ